MEENVKKDPISSEEEGFLEKAKKLVGKADDFIDENVDKVMKSKAFESVAETFDKAGDFIEEKIEDIKKANVKEKLETLADKAEDKADETLIKAKDLGKKLANETAGKLEEIAENIRSKTKEEKKP